MKTLFLMLPAFALLAACGSNTETNTVASGNTMTTEISTDTGSFRYSATTPRTHAIVADILDRGDIRPEPIHVAIHDGRSRGSLRLLSRALDTIATHYGGRVATMFVDQRMLRETETFSDEAEGLVQYALSLDGVKADGGEKAAEKPGDKPGDKPAGSGNRNRRRRRRSSGGAPKAAAAE